MVVNERAKSIVSKYVDDGESILWSDQSHSTRPALHLGFFSALVVIFVYIIATDHSGRPDRVASDLFQDAISLLLYTSFVLGCLKIYLRRRVTAYAITDSRLIIVQDGRPDSVLSFRTIDPAVLEAQGVNSAGFGDVVVAIKRRKLPDGGEKVLEIRLLAIPDADSVAALLREKFGSTTGAASG